MNNLRKLLYQLARLLGDINAVQKGKIGSRLVNKALGRGLVSKAYLRGSGCGCLLPVIMGILLIVGYFVFIGLGFVHNGLF